MALACQTTTDETWKGDEEETQGPCSVCVCVCVCVWVCGGGGGGQAHAGPLIIIGSSSKTATHQEKGHSRDACRS